MKGSELNTITGRKFVVSDSESIDVVTIHHYVSQCCGLNTLQNFTGWGIQNEDQVEKLFNFLKENHMGTSKLPSYFTMKHFFFTTGMGFKYEGQPYKREDTFKYLIERPEVKLINRYRSASEPDHDVGMFFVDLT